MASSSGIKGGIETVKSLLSYLSPQQRERALGLISLGLFLYVLMAQSPEALPVTAKPTSVTVHESATDTMHVVIPGGSFSDLTSVVTTDTLSWKE